jgi:hypothetical protein
MSGQGSCYSKIQNDLSIHDNINIPLYLIEMLKELIKNTPSNYHYLHHYHWEIVFNTIKQLKTSLKELTYSPHYMTDIKTKFDISINKNELLETQIKEMEQKIKNI